ncbi:MAG: hypothetical protein CVV23_13740 [Ignavibacteriae bacterium HGW-Ignavibacteriae-2]|jgi:HEAT repeat protein|nr:MAG: hypothetical protein CVV23_13740 [Ignavibacteriae bacterium HGW-Ignavibacteriae-2]
MLTQIYKNIILVIIVLILFSADKPLTANNKPNENAIKNLINGINSQNDGLKRSSIYLSGCYKINETVDALVKLIDHEVNISTKLLIIRSLYNIGDLKGMIKIHDISLYDENDNVRSIAAAVYQAYLLINTPFDKLVVVQR